MYVAGQSDFDVGNIHFEGQCQGWALIVETFWGPGMAMSKASTIDPLIHGRGQICSPIALQAKNFLSL